MIEVTVGSMKRYGGWGYDAVVSKDGIPQIIVFGWTVGGAVRKAKKEVKKLLDDVRR